jgi:hypothetical protein
MITLQLDLLKPSVVRPFMRCDFCNEVITDAAGALFVWEDEDVEKPDVGPVSGMFACERCDEEEECGTYTKPLDQYLVWLLESVNLTGQAFAKAKARAGLNP